MPGDPETQLAWDVGLGGTWRDERDQDEQRGDRLHFGHVFVSAGGHAGCHICGHPARRAQWSAAVSLSEEAFAGLPRLIFAP